MERAGSCLPALRHRPTMCEFAILVLLAAGTAVAQQPAAAVPGPAPRPEVEAALRDRVARFFQALAAGKYRQADQYVAEDTKDYFYALQKVPLIRFAIGKIIYSDNFTKAQVGVKTVREVAQPLIPKMRLDNDETSDWKIENGQWCWTVDQTVTRTPFGDFHHPPPASGTASAEAIPPAIPIGADLTKTVAADKSDIELGERESEQIMLQNAMPGPVILSLDWPDTPGLVAKLDHAEIGPRGVARLLLTYKPSAGDGRAGRLTLSILVQPTGQVIPIRVTLKTAAGARK